MTSNPIASRENGKMSQIHGFKKKSTNQNLKLRKLKSLITCDKYHPKCYRSLSNNHYLTLAER